jgi:hypothetical protein
MFRLSAVHMYFSSTIPIQVCRYKFKKIIFLLCLNDLQICSSNVFFINNPDPDPKLRLKPDPNPEKNNYYFGSTTLIILITFKTYQQNNNKTTT